SDRLPPKSAEFSVRLPLTSAMLTLPDPCALTLRVVALKVPLELIDPLEPLVVSVMLVPDRLPNCRLRELLRLIAPPAVAETSPKSWLVDEFRVIEPPAVSPVVPPTRRRELTP